jgi:hypothetical protein
LFIPEEEDGKAVFQFRSRGYCRKAAVQFIKRRWKSDVRTVQKRRMERLLYTVQKAAGKARTESKGWKAS